MQTARIAIIGGGVSGLYAAYLLEQNGISDYILLEARPEFGGRIASLNIASHPEKVGGSFRDEANRFDLGPTWFWPTYQAEFWKVIVDLQLTAFDQFEFGDMLIDSGHGPPQRIPRLNNWPTSMRLHKGMGALVDALRGKLTRERQFADRAVKSISQDCGVLQLHAQDAEGNAHWFQVQYVLLAVPPRLAADSIVFHPALPPGLERVWHDTGTWMAPHAKYLAVFERPFWRERSLSGQARSARGPMAEIHDASLPDGQAALFGFIGVPAHHRMQISGEQIVSRCRDQLVRLFGPEAELRAADALKDWSREPFTATAADLDGVGAHILAPPSQPSSGAWRGRVFGIASEWSPRYAGYLAGAVEAAVVGVNELWRILEHEPKTGIQTKEP